MRIPLLLLVLATGPLLRADPIHDLSVADSNAFTSRTWSIYDSSGYDWKATSLTQAADDWTAGNTEQLWADAEAQRSFFVSHQSFLGLFYYCDRDAFDQFADCFREWSKNWDCAPDTPPPCVPVESVPDSTSVAFLLAVTAVGLALVKRMTPDHLG